MIGDVSRHAVYNDDNHVTARPCYLNDLLHLVALLFRQEKIKMATAQQDAGVYGSVSVGLGLHAPAQAPAA